MCGRCGAARGSCRGKRRAGFRVGGYDRTASLVIDPVLVYSTYLGGSRDETALAVAADAAGNAFVTGWTSSTDFPTAGPPFQGSHAGTTDVFVAKLSPSFGPRLLHLPGRQRGRTTATGIAVDAAGNAYVTGETTSTDFPTAGPPFQPTSAGGHDAFVTKLSPTGSAPRLLHLPGRQRRTTIGHGIAVDAAGNAYVTGATDSDRLPHAGLPFQTDHRRGLRRLRGQAEPDRCDPRLLHLPGRRRRATLASASRWTPPATPT